MRGLARIFVVGFTVITLMLVAAVGVSATTGSAGSAHAFNSVVGLFSGHTNGNGDDKCPPPKNHHHHISGGDKDCDDDDSG